MPVLELKTPNTPGPSGLQSTAKRPLIAPPPMSTSRRNRKAREDGATGLVASVDRRQASGVHHLIFAAR